MINVINIRQHVSGFPNDALNYLQSSTLKHEANTLKRITDRNTLIWRETNVQRKLVDGIGYQPIVQHLLLR